MATRVAAGSGPLSDLVREQQDLAEQLFALDKSLVAALSASPAARNAEAEADLRKRAYAARRRLTELGTALATRFPEFAALAAPQPVSLADVREALAPDEALFTIALTRHGSFIWLITKETLEKPVSTTGDGG